MDRPGQTKGADIGSLGQQVVGDKKKELTKILKMYIRAALGNGTGKPTGIQCSTRTRTRGGFYP